MAIRPPSDIVLDVARAADPVRSQAALAKLARMSASSPADGDLFADLLGEASSSASAREALDPEGDLADLRTGMALADSAGLRLRQESKAGKALEAFVLQNFIESMIPKNERVFGKGTAGQVWRSMMAEQMSKQIAEAGGIGIARALAPRMLNSGAVAPSPGANLKAGSAGEGSET